MSNNIPKLNQSYQSFRISDPTLSRMQDNITSSLNNIYGFLNGVFTTQPTTTGSVVSGYPLLPTQFLPGSLTSGGGGGASLTGVVGSLNYAYTEIGNLTGSVTYVQAEVATIQATYTQYTPIWSGFGDNFGTGTVAAQEFAPGRYGYAPTGSFGLQSAFFNVMPKAGYIAAIYISTAYQFGATGLGYTIPGGVMINGQLSHFVYKNASALSGCAATISTSAGSNLVTFSPGSYAFAAGDAIYGSLYSNYARITNSGNSGTNAGFAFLSCWVVM